MNNPDIEEIHVYERCFNVANERDSACCTNAGKDDALLNKSTNEWIAAFPASPIAPATLPTSWNGNNNVATTADVSPDTALPDMERSFDMETMTLFPILLTTTDAAASISLLCRADILALPSADAEKKSRASPKTDKT